MTTDQAPARGTVPLWSDERIEAQVREVAHKDLPDMRTWSVTEFQAQQLMMLVRTDFQRENINMHTTIEMQRAIIAKLEMRLAESRIGELEGEVANLRDKLRVANAANMALVDELDSEDDDE